MGRVVDQGQGRLQQGLGSGLVLGREGRVKLPELMPEAGAVRPIQCRAGAGLFDALESGLMACHRFSF